MHTADHSLLPSVDGAERNSSPTTPLATSMRSQLPANELIRHDQHPSSSASVKQTSSNEGGLPTFSTLRSFLTITEPPHQDPEGSHSLKHKKADNGSHDDSSPYGTVRARKTPIFSGLMAPFSIVLEVPGLTSKWYAKIDQDGLVIRFIDNPVVLTVFLSISLGAAVVANLAIVCRFLEILPPRVSIALAIAGFALHDLINVVALAVFGGIYGPKNDGLSLSASYWMVCASTITSALVTASLVIDYVRTKDFKNAGSGLTQLQKGLVLAGMALLLYLSLGSLIFVFVIDIDFITALYFSCATVLTVGFGDVVPLSPGGKVLVILYAPVGIVLVAIVVSSARNTILETFQESLMQRRKEHKLKMAQRRAAQADIKHQDRVLKRMLTRTRTFTFGPGTAAPGGRPDDFASAFVQMENNASSVGSKEKESPSGSINAEKADASQLRSIPDAGLVDVGMTGDPELQVEIAALQHSLLVQKQRTEEDFRHFEKHAQVEERYAAKMKMILAASITMAFWLLGAMAFKFAERWSYGGAMWFCFISMITIGYGDYHPATQLGRAIFVIWGLLGVAVLTILLAVVQDAFGSVFHRLLVGSTTRLFDRAERRARKRRHKKDIRRSSSASAPNNHVAQARVSSQSDRSQAKRRKQSRKSHDFAYGNATDSEKQAPPQRAIYDSPEPDAHDKFPQPQPEAMQHDADEKKLRWLSNRQQQLHRFPSRVSTLPSPSYGSFVRRAIAPDEAPCEVETTLVTQPQRLARAALVTYQHSMQVLRLHELQIMKTMVEVPALRTYYNARQRTNSLSESGSMRTATSTRAVQESEMDEKVAIEKLYSGIKQTGNQEHEKIARLVVANLEFETQLRKLLAEISGLKSQVEQSFNPPTSMFSAISQVADTERPDLPRRLSY